MFTGIIEAQGIVEALKRQGYSLSLGISAPFAGEVKTGDSASVNGVCLTAARIQGGVMYFDAVEETLKDTTLSRLRLKERVNLERAMKSEGRVGGHFVTGHIDTTGLIRKNAALGAQVTLEIAIDNKFAGGIVKKGSIAVDGISLTVSELSGGSFSVNIIPHTLNTTTLGFKNPGDYVNIELDMLGKYAQRQRQAGGGITEDFLRERGFV